MGVLIQQFRESFLSKPLKVYGTSMQPNLLLMCKMLILLLFAHGYFFYLGDPFLPFIAQLDYLNNMPFLFDYLTKSIFIISSVLLIFNIRVRAMAVTLGLTIIISLLASKPLFRNHLLIVACMLFLAGLSRKNETPWLIYFQLSLVYFGALTKKILQVDWWSGQFMHNWLSEALHSEFYRFASVKLSSMLLAKLISYAAMLSELIIGIFLIIPKLRFSAITIILIFHSMLFTFTGEWFGFFMEDILIVLIAFSSWSHQKSSFKYKFQKFSKLARIVEFLDFDNRIAFQLDSSLSSPVMYVSNGKAYSNILGITKTLLTCAGFFYVLIFFQLAILILFNDDLKYFASLIFLWSLLLLLSPLLFDKLKGLKHLV